MSQPTNKSGAGKAEFITALIAGIEFVRQQTQKLFTATRRWKMTEQDSKKLDHLIERLARAKKYQVHIIMREIRTMLAKIEVEED